MTGTGLAHLVLPVLVTAVAVLGGIDLRRKNKRARLLFLMFLWLAYAGLCVLAPANPGYTATAALSVPMLTDTIGILAISFFA